MICHKNCRLLFGKSPCMDPCPGETDLARIKQIISQRESTGREEPRPTCKKHPGDYGLNCPDCENDKRAYLDWKSGKITPGAPEKSENEAKRYDATCNLCGWTAHSNGAWLVKPSLSPCLNCTNGLLKWSTKDS